MIQGEGESQLKNWHGQNYEVSGWHFTSASSAEVVVVDNLWGCSEQFSWGLTSVFLLKRATWHLWVSRLGQWKPQYQPPFFFLYVFWRFLIVHGIWILKAVLYNSEKMPSRVFARYFVKRSKNKGEKKKNTSGMVSDAGATKDYFIPFLHSAVVFQSILRGISTECMKC